MAILPAQAGLSDLNLSEWTALDTQTAGNESAHAMNNGDGQATPRAASENPFSSADRVEISRLNASAQLETISAGVRISGEDGTYSLTAAVQALSARVELESVERTASAGGERDRFNIDAGALRGRIENHLADAFGAGSDQVQRFGEVTDWLSSGDPGLYQGMLLLMLMQAEENPDAAEEMIEQLEQLRAVFGSGPPGARARAVLGVYHVNVEASFQAVHATAGPAPGQGGAQASAGSISIRVNGTMVRVEAEAESAQGDPLVLDLDGDGIDLKSADEGVEFDIEGTGRKRRTAFIQGDDALLYLDRDGNGVANLGTELFGDQEGDAHGFSKLMRLDENEDGAIDAKDAAYASLRLWQDRNGDGINQAAESMTLDEGGVERIFLDYADTREEDGKGNVIAQLSAFARKGGGTGIIADALLKYYL